LEQEFFCLGRLGSQGSKEKSGFEEFRATWESVFSFNFLWANFFLNLKKKYFSIRIEKLYKMACIIFPFFLKKFEKVEKIGHHSNFNFDCNTERGFKESLSIALGLK
jgi:hypothetical protein